MPKGRRRPLELRVSSSNAGGFDEAQQAITKLFKVATTSRGSSAETSSKPKDSVQPVRRRQSLLSGERSRKQDREQTRKLKIPGAYHSFSTQGSKSSPSCLSGSSSESGSDTDVIKAVLPPRKPQIRRRKSEPPIETEDDAEERPSRTPKQLRPDFEPFKSKGVARRPKDRRSINFEILNCIKTASKKKNKSTPNANLGSIYVFESPVHAPDHLKVGKSNRDPMKRKGEWEKCGVTLIEVEDTDRNCFDHYDIVELLLQTELQNLRRMYKCGVCGRKHNEWFEADKWTVLEVIDRWRTWIKEEQPFDEAWNLTAYWQWRVERAKVSISDVRNLSGKTAIITGSSRGIGARIAKGLAQRGANVVVNYTSARGEAAAAALARDIEALGRKAAGVQANVAIFADLNKIINSALAVSENGKIDLLVHNGATGDDCFLEEMTEEFYQAQMDVNLKGRNNDITVNCVSPGPVETDMWKECEPEVIADFQHMFDATPAALRVGEVSDIVPIVAFLCSEESRWVTGSVVSASGWMSFI
ncbi:hypothetical protein IFR05_004676 [Cadophora sp. M221]|nr:hypothetical protein IFR05_004676 [Cadophora sp. M221]